MELFGDLPDSLKNLIIKQSIGSDKCDELTNDGKKCGESFIYSINNYMISAKELKKVMVNCTKFCLKHLSDLAINGELKFGYESKEERRITSMKKRVIMIMGSKDSNYKILLRFDFEDKNIWLKFTPDLIDDINNFTKTMIKSKKGYPSNIEKIDDKYTVKFKRMLISGPWRKFIMDCFRYENLDIELIVEGKIDQAKWNPKGGWEKQLKYKNYILALGNLDSIRVTHLDRIGADYIVSGIKRINI